MDFSRELISGPQREVWVVLDMQIDHNWIVFLSSEGDCMEFCQVKKWGRACGPIIRHSEVIGKIGAETTWEFGTKIGVCSEHRFPTLKERFKELASLNRTYS
jgi:hypothetical protein